MPPKSVFREPKNVKEEKDYLDSCIPKATRYATKWAYKVFGEWQSSRRNKDANFEETGLEVELGCIVEMSAEILEFLADKVCLGGVKREWRTLSHKRFVQYLLWIATSVITSDLYTKITVIIFSLIIQ